MLVAIVLAVAAPASAAAEERSSRDGAMNGCPQGSLMVDRPNGPGGTPPSYLPGGNIATSGYVNDTRFAGGQVKIRWGTADGPEMASGQTDSQGHWRGVTFQIPAEAEHGTYRIYAEALDHDGRTLTGFPIPLEIRVGPPLPQTTERTVRPREQEPERARRSRDRSQEAPTRSLEAAAPSTAVPPSSHGLALPAGHGSRASTTDEEATSASPAARARRVARPSIASVLHGSGSAPGRAAPSARAAADRAAPRGGSDGTMGLPAAILAGLALAVAAGGGAWTWRTRRAGPGAGAPAASPTPPDRGPAPPESGAVSDEDRLVEAELQEMIAEQRALDLGRERERRETGVC